MIYGYVGTYDDVNSAGCLRGNGKTCSAVYYAYQEYLDNRYVFSNFYTTFSEQLSTQEIIDLFFSDKSLKNITILIDEIQIILNSIGTKGKVLKFIMKMAGQTRKRTTDIYYTTQRYYDLHLRMRVQTNVVLEPHKFHYIILENKEIALTDLCISDKCREPHIIAVICRKPYREIIDYLIPENIGKMYNSDEIIDEEINL